MRCLGVIMLAALLLQGCAAGGPGAGGQGDVQLFDDPFQPFYEYRTVEKKRRVNDGVIIMQLIGRRNRRSNDVTTVLRIQYSYISGLRRKYHAARDKNAIDLKFRKITANGNCRGASSCPHFEAFDVSIPARDLRSAPETGYQLKIFSKVDNDTKFTLTRASIRQFFAAIDRPVAARKKSRG